MSSSPTKKTVTEFLEAMQRAQCTQTRAAKLVRVSRGHLRDICTGRKSLTNTIARRMQVFIDTPAKLEDWSECTWCKKPLQLTRPNQSMHKHCSGEKLAAGAQKRQRKYLQKKKLRLQDKQRSLLGEALRKHDWNFKTAAFSLGITESCARKRAARFFPEQYAERMKTGTAPVVEEESGGGVHPWVRDNYKEFRHDDTD